MSALTQIQELCALAVEQIEEATSAVKVNKAAHGRLRINLNQIKKLVTAAKQESMDACK
jgi:hypothetical protein